MKNLKKAKIVLSVAIVFLTLLLIIPLFMVAFIKDPSDNTGVILFVYTGIGDIVYYLNHQMAFDLLSNFRLFWIPAVVILIIGIIVATIVVSGVANTKSKGFAVFATIIGWILWAIFLMLCVWQMDKVLFEKDNDMIKVDHKIIPTVLFAIGIILWFVGNILASTGLSHFGNLDDNNANDFREKVINLKTQKIGARGVTPQKSMEPIASKAAKVNGSIDNDALKMRAIELRKKLNAIGSPTNAPAQPIRTATSIVPDQPIRLDTKPPVRAANPVSDEEYRASRGFNQAQGFVNSFNNSLKSTGPTYQQKPLMTNLNDVIKNRVNDNIVPFKFDGNENDGVATGTIILPSSKRDEVVDTNRIESKINRYDDANKLKVNPNARVYKQYQNRVFFGDTDKIWDLTISNRQQALHELAVQQHDDDRTLRKPVDDINVNVNINFNNQNNKNEEDDR